MHRSPARARKTFLRNQCPHALSPPPRGGCRRSRLGEFPPGLHTVARELPPTRFAGHLPRRGRDVSRLRERRTEDGAPYEAAACGERTALASPFMGSQGAHAKESLPAVPRGTPGNMSVSVIFLIITFSHTAARLGAAVCSDICAQMSFFSRRSAIFASS